MAKFKYQVVHDGVVVGTRKSDRVYSHAIIARQDDGEWFVFCFCGRLDLAQMKMAGGVRQWIESERKRGRDGSSAEIVAVTVEE